MKVKLILLAALIFITAGAYASYFDFETELEKAEKSIPAVKQSARDNLFDESYKTAFWVLHAPVFAQPDYPEATAAANTLAHRTEVAAEKISIMEKNPAQKNTAQKNQLAALKDLNNYAVTLQNTSAEFDCSAYKRETLEQADNDLSKAYENLRKDRQVNEITKPEEIQALVKASEKILELKLCAEKFAFEDKNRIDNPPSEGYWIMVNTTQNILYLYEGGVLQKTCKAATGRLTEWGKAVEGSKTYTYDIKYEGKCTPTPNQMWCVTDTAQNRTFGKGTEYEDPGGPDGTFGTRWMCLNNSGYAIHGTNNPKSLGKNATHGCVRVSNDNAEYLYKYVGIGTLVCTGDSCYLAARPWEK